MSEYRKLEFEDKVADSLSIVESFERRNEGSSKAFIDEINDPRVLEWVNLLIKTWNGSEEPAVILDKTINSFLAGNKTTTGNQPKYPYGFYNVIQLVCFDVVPKSVRSWIDKTPYLDGAVKADLHAMLDSRQFAFDK